MVDGWGWLWMTLMMGFWIALIGIVVFVALWFARRPLRAGHV
jgi:hypothetical protein